MNEGSSRQRAFVPLIPIPGMISERETVLSGFLDYADGKSVEESLTDVKIFRSETYLFLNVLAREPLHIVTGSPGDGYAALEGDHLEIFFGESGDDGWYRHFVVSAGGGRFSEFAELSEWDAEVVLSPDRWSMDPGCASPGALRSKSAGRLPARAPRWWSTAGRENPVSGRRMPIRFPARSGGTEPFTVPVWKISPPDADMSSG